MTGLRTSAAHYAFWMRTARCRYREGGRSFHLAYDLLSPGLNGPASALLPSLSIRLPDRLQAPELNRVLPDYETGDLPFVLPAELEKGCISPIAPSA